MAQMATLTLPSHDGNTPYDEVWDLTLDTGDGAEAISSPEWSGLRADFCLQRTSEVLFSLAQVSAAVEGVRPLSDGGWRVRIDQDTLSAAVTASGGGVLVATLLGDDAEGIERAIASVTLPIHYGTTAP